MRKKQPAGVLVRLWKRQRPSDLRVRRAPCEAEELRRELAARR